MQFPAGEISSYTVPAGVQTLRITAEGAGGGDSFHSNGDPTQTSGGPGAVLTGRVAVESETELSILVGEFPGSSTNIDCSGGGGGSFVGVGTDLNAFSGENLLFVAGGGGGACNGDGGEGGTPDGGTGSNQVDGNSGEPGGYGGIGNGDGGDSGHAGAGGGGGAAIDDHGSNGTANNPGSNLARGGAGGSGAGGNGGDAATEATGGQAAVNGGSGGEYGGPFNATNGGFGGGGAGGEYGGGGGGGYAGGGGGGYNRGGGGGGSSFFADEVTDRTVEAGNTGHGTVLFCLRSIQPDPGNILYIDQNVTGDNQTGDSWENALPELRDALQWATDEWDGDTDGTLQIWVAEGVYLPTGDPGDRDAAFPLLDQVEIYGGFPPGGGTWEDRDWQAYPAVLSGQVDEDDETIRSVHVVTANDVDNSAILDGFTVTGGGDSTNPGRAGGGLYVSDASPTLSHLAILGNRVSWRGGGMYSAGGDPVLLNVRFAGNQAAMGGGMSVHDSNPDMVNVEFLGNRATSDFFGGGGLHATDADPLLINATFSGNWASGNRGGAIFNSNSSPALRNVIIWNNRATGAPITSSIHNEEDSAPHIAHSLIQDSGGSGNWYSPIGIDGGGNIDAPPLFVDMPDWQDAPAAVGDSRLDRASPAIDRGDPDTDMSIFPAGIDGVPVDLGGDRRVYDGAVTVIDMGAYEFQGDRFELTPHVDNILYVDANVDTGAADYTGAGDSWGNAVSELADALLWTRRQHDISEGWSDPDGQPLHIYIARGTYTPRYNASDNLYHTNGNRDNAFVVVSGVHLYGGFDPENGITELGDPRLLPGPNPNRGTILSGILAGGNGDVYHVLVASRAISNPPRVDGVSVTGGEADGEDWIMVYRFRVYRNGGGGLQIVDTPLMLVNAYIRTNSAVQGGGIRAGTFSPTLINVAIVGNSADDGGGMFSTRGEPELINATISGNTASGQGGGLYIDDLTVPILKNSILWGNTAGGGGNEVYNNHGMWFTDSVYRDRDGENDIAGDGWFNTRDVTTDDPHFADPASDDLRLLPGSPAIFTGSDIPFQAGEPAEGVTTDLAGNPRFVDGQIDPGAWQHPGFVLVVTPEQQAATLGAAYAPITVAASARTDTGFADPGDYPLAGGEVMAAYPESGATVIFDGVTGNPLTLELDGDGRAVTPEPVAAGEVGDFGIEFNSQGADPVTAQMRNLALYAVTATVAGGNGAITPDEQIVVEGEDAVVTVTPDTGWHIDSVAGDTCVPANQGDGTWAVENITADCAVSAVFAINEYTVVASAGENGSIAPAVQNVAHGDTAIFTVTPDTGWHVDSVTGDTCNPVDQGDGTWAAENITADCAVSAAFAINEYAVTASAGENGGIAPDAQTVTHGDTAEFTVTPNAGYSATITGDCPGGDLKGGTYSTGPIVADCAVIADFTRNPPVSLVIDGGDGQSAAVNTAFAEPLAVRVRDDQGDPLPGIAVNFEVQEAGGAGAMLSAAQAETDDQGLAAITATANGTAGDYTVTATVAGLEPAVFALTNTVLETTLELAASADTIDEGDTLILTATVTGAAARGSVIPTGTVDFRTGNRTLCDAVELVDGMAECEVDDLPAGEHLIEASYGGDAAFAATSAAVTVTVEGEVPEAVVIPTINRFGLLLLVLMSLVIGLSALRAGR